MIHFPKPRGFWDYAIFALMMTGGLSVLFQLEASDRIGWADAALAFASAALFVFGTILARQGEKATWIKQPLTWRVNLMMTLGLVTLIFGALYADAYLLHPRDITAPRFWRNMIIAILLTVASRNRKRKADKQRSGSVEEPISPASKTG